MWISQARSKLLMLEFREMWKGGSAGILGGSDSKDRSGDRYCPYLQFKSCVMERS